MLHIVEGIPGSGKSYVAVDWFMLDYLENTTRIIYTNLPVNVENVITWLLRYRYRKTMRSPALRERFASVIRQRIVKLSWEKHQPYQRNDQGQTILDSEGNPLPVYEKTKKVFYNDNIDDIPKHAENQERYKTGWRYELEVDHPLSPCVECQNFWYFCGPNAVVLLDECADIFNARNWKNLQDSKLQTYINHHRHFKDDLYIFAQSINDLDKQLRTKVGTLYVLSNSTKENMFESQWGMGIKWPVQFFFARTFIRMGNKFTHQDTYRVFPNKDGFKNYDSFSQAETFTGKALPSAESKSEDLPSWRQALRGFFRRSSSLIMLLCMFLGGIGGFYFLIHSLLAASRSDSLKAIAEGEKAQKKHTEKNLHVTKNEPPKSKPPAVPENIQKPERLLFVSPGQVKTDRGSYTLDTLPPDLVEPVRAILERQRRGLLARPTSP